jgi:uncharacterized membrane protein YccC
MIRETISGLWEELKELPGPGPRARTCLMATLAVTLAVAAALALHLPDVWWAGISAFMSTQAAWPASLQRAAMRIVGTMAGAWLAILVAPALAHDHVTGSLLVLIFATVGGVGSLVSRHGYAWLFMGITANLVLMASLTNPPAAFTLGVYRVLEVIVGAASALLIAVVLAPDDPVAPAPQAPGWSDLLGKNWEAVLHAFRAGLAIMLLPLVWSWLDLPSLPQMAISVAAVMAVPSLSANPDETARNVIGRAAHRLLGCFLGGIAALALLWLSISAFVPWLVALGAGIWICCHVQVSTRGVGYVGTQAAIVFIITLVQGWSPADSILPGVDRFAGVACGLAVLLVVTAVIWPDPHPAAQSAVSGDSRT